MTRPLAWAVCCLAVVACAPQPQRAIAPPLSTEVAPAQQWLDAMRRGERVYRVDAASSLVVIEVRRGGSFSQFGHDHVVASRDAHGFVAADSGRAEVRFRLDAMTVDEPTLREEAGFTTRPSAEDVAGTRVNMLERVLEADRHPEAVVNVAGANGDAVRVTLTLHGVTRDVAPAPAVLVSDDAIEASGRCEILQTDYGMTPLSILGGAIRVEDRVVVRYRIRATRIAG